MNLVRVFPGLAFKSRAHIAKSRRHKCVPFHRSLIEASSELTILALSVTSPSRPSSSLETTSSTAATLPVRNWTMQSGCFWKNRAISVTFWSARPVPTTTTSSVFSNPRPSPPVAAFWDCCRIRLTRSPSEAFLWDNLFVNAFREEAASRKFLSSCLRTRAVTDRKGVLGVTWMRRAELLDAAIGLEGIGRF